MQTLAEYLREVARLAGQLDWTAERLAAERQSGLRALVAHAKKHSSFYARRLAKLDAASVSEADLASIPPLDKGELMRHWDEIVTAPSLSLERCEAHLGMVTHEDLRLDGYRVFTTGGSTGVRAVVPYGDDEWRLFGAGSRRRILRYLAALGIESPLNPVVAQIQAPAATHMSGMVGTGMEAVVIHPLPASLPLGEIVKSLNEIQPIALTSYASILRMLAEESLSGRLQISPATILSGGEPLSSEDLEIVRSAWQAPVFDLYGTSEVGMLASSDGVTPGLYLNDDLVLIEPVDADGRPVAAGERSAKLYATPLYHRTLPLLRYEVTDEVTLLEEPCPNGSSFRRIARVEGRLDDCFTYDGGIRIHPIVFRSPLTRERSIKAYQVRQSERGAAIQVLAEGSIDCASLERRVERGLAKAGLVAPRVSVEQVTSIQRTRNGAKLKRFLPL
jgi:phenylacetate-coenzyme A ligase PaaK-like adenylate-forming protein